MGKMSAKTPPGKLVEFSVFPWVIVAALLSNNVPITTEPINSAMTNVVTPVANHVIWLVDTAASPCFSE